MTTTDKTQPKLTRRTRIALIVAGVLALAGLCVVLVNVTSNPAATPTPYKVTATGNVRATWYSDSTSGNLDLNTSYDIQTVTARSLSVSVDSTLPEGASCRIEGPNGETYVNHAPANGDTIVTATCATK